jgi:hypothetical protein
LLYIQTTTKRVWDQSIAAFHRSSSGQSHSLARILPKILFSMNAHNTNDPLIPKSSIVSVSSNPAHHQSTTPKDDLDLMLQHVDFPKLIWLAAQVKKLRKGDNSCADRLLNGHKGKHLQTDEVLNAVHRLQETLIGKQERLPVIERGQYPITDCLLDEAMTTLQDELNAACYAMATTTAPVTPNHAPSYVPSRAGSQKTTASTKLSNKKEAIAIKYSKHQTDMLMNWMIAHVDQPFPGPQDVTALMQQTGLTQSQVVNWTTNVRKRNRKATCQNGKKPHHFIDFMFLKQDRQAKAQGGEGRSDDNSICGGGCSNSSRMIHFADDYMSSCAHSHSHTLHYSLEPLQGQAEFNQLLQEQDFEPLYFDPSDNDDDVVMLSEFADFWLSTDDGADSSSPTTILSRILPSVTNDSHDEIVVAVDDATHDNNNNKKRLRGLSFDLPQMDEDIFSWAAEMGLTIEL